MARPRKSNDTRQQLLDEGVSAFLMHGYHGTGLKQVLDRVGVPKGSFYNYFESKEAFGAATIEHYAECLAEKLSSTMAVAPDALSGLKAFFELQMKAFAASNHVGGCLVANLGAEFEGSQVFREALSGALRRYQGGVAAALEQAQKDGTVRADMPAEMLSAMLVDTWEGAVIRMKIEQNLAPLQECIDRLLGGFFRP